MLVDCNPQERKFYASEAIKAYKGITFIFSVIYDEAKGIKQVQLMPQDIHSTENSVVNKLPVIDFSEIFDMANNGKLNVKVVRKILLFYRTECIRDLRESYGFPGKKAQVTTIYKSPFVL